MTQSTIRTVQRLTTAARLNLNFPTTERCSELILWSGLAGVITWMFLAVRLKAPGTQKGNFL